MKTYVVDQNWFRSNALVELMAEEPTSCFVVPDVALLEMSKSANWKGTMRPSLAVFAAAPDRLFVSMSIAEAIRYELSSLSPIKATQLLPDAFTSSGRQMVSELASERPESVLRWIESGFGDAFNAWQSAELDSELAKAQLVSHVSVFKGLKKEVLKAIADPLHAAYRLAFISASAEMLVQDHLIPKHVSEAEAGAFLEERPLVLRYVILLIRQSLDWAAKGGVEGLPADKELNNRFDMEYVVTASYFDGLLSRDNGACGAYHDLRKILESSPQDIEAALLSLPVAPASQRAGC